MSELNTNEQPMRCAIYARYSSDAQSPKSIDDQVRECKTLIQQRKGWRIDESHIYADYAISGAAISRDGYDSLKRAAASRQFDYVVVDDLSRLGRDHAEDTIVFREFRLLGIGIVSVADGIDTGTRSAKLPLYFKSIMNEIFLDDLKAKIVRGLKGQVSRGYSAGGRVYGYDYEPEYFESGEKDKFGRPKRHGVRVVVNDEQAEMIRRIFKLYASGMGYKSIASVLNEEGVPSPHAGRGSRSGYWSRSTVHSILKQGKYAGDWTWNKTSWNKKNFTGKRIKRNNPESEWVKLQIEELRIVPHDLWVQVQQRLASVKSKGNSGRSRAQYPLSGFLKCGKCGSSMIVHGSKSKSHSAYVCSGYQHGGKAVCDSRHRLPREKAEEAVLGGIADFLGQDRLVRQLSRAVIDELRVLSSSRQADRAGLERRKTSVQRAIDNLLSALEKGDAPDTALTRLREREIELASIDTQLRSSLPDSVPQLAAIQDTVRDSLASLSDLLCGHPSSVRELKALLAQIVPSKATVSPQRRGKKVIMNIDGEIAPLQYAGFPLRIHSGAGT